MLHKEVKELAQKAFELNPSMKRTIVYLIEENENYYNETEIDNTLNRVGELPSFIKKSMIPENSKFAFCIDYDSMPEIKRPKDIRATMFTVESCDTWDMNAKESNVEVIDLKDDELMFDELDKPNKDEKGFRLVKLEVPEFIFVDLDDLEVDFDEEYLEELEDLDEEELEDLDEEEREKYLIYKKYLEFDKELQDIIKEMSSKVNSASAYFGGQPRYIQYTYYDSDDFIMQIDSDLFPEDVNFGDCGIMYIFTDDCFVQSH